MRDEDESAEEEDEDEEKESPEDEDESDEEEDEHEEKESSEDEDESFRPPGWTEDQGQQTRPTRNSPRKRPQTTVETYVLDSDSD